MSSSPAPLTWLQAAEHVLREEGPEMHIKDLTTRILELGIVKSNCATSLETLLYRQTSGSIQGKGVNARIITGPTKFIRVQGKHGWFGLKPSVLLEESEFHNISLDSIDTAIVEDNSDSEHEMEIDHKFPYPSQQSQLVLQQHQMLKKRTSPHSSDDESHTQFFLMSSEDDDDEDSSDEEEEEEDELDDSLDVGLSGEDEDAELDESLYRKRYWFLKRLAKRIIFENFSLANQLLVTEERIKRAEVERKFLFKKLLVFEQSGITKRSVSGILPSSMLKSRSRPPVTHLSSQPTDTSSSNQRLHVGYEAADEELPSNGSTKRGAGHLGRYGSRFKRQKMSEADSRRGLDGDSEDRGRSEDKSRGREWRNKGIGGGEDGLGEKRDGERRVSATLNSSKDQSKLLMSDSSENSEGDWNEDSDEGSGKLFMSPSSLKHRRRQGRAEVTKKKKAGQSDGVSKKRAEEDLDGDGDEEELELAMRSGKVRRLHPIPLNKDGTPVFPIVVGGLKVSNLGKIVYDRVAYHSERYLLPVEFESTRMYPSMIDPARRCLYTCRILDGGDTPIFEMVADDDLDNPIRASSSTACQSIVLKNINKARDKQATNSGSGPEFFGYSNPTVLNLLQKMPDAKKCPKYKFVRFAEPSRRGGGRKMVANNNNEIKKVGMKTKGVISKGKKSASVSSKKMLTPKSVFGNASSKGPRSISNSIAIAPVLGTKDSQVNYHGLGSVDDSSDSSSSELSSATDNELVIDS